MSYPVSLDDGKIIHIVLTEEAENELEKIAKEYPKASFEELMHILRQRRKGNK